MHRLLAACFFPESIRDQLQTLVIADIERAEFLRVGEENYKPSDIMSSAAQMVEKRAAQLYVVGFVALAFIWLKVNGFSPSLNRASIIASCAANEFRGVTLRPGLKPKGADQFKAVPSDPATIESIFRKYRSVAHICAARISTAGYLEHTHLWDETPEVTASIMQTCAAFQTALEDVTNTASWNIWDVKKHFPAALHGWPVLTPDDELEAWVRRGYEIAVDQGLIQPKRGGR